MMGFDQETTLREQESVQEEQEIGLLREWLPKISGECRDISKARQKLCFTRRKNLRR